ncbi:MAG: hypothetical protein ABFD60_17075 [Bryobacteraceae bacterium]
MLLGVLILLSMLVVVLAILWLRYRNQQMQHQERMAALEKGIQVVPASRPPVPWSPRVYLLRGLIWSLTGAALTGGLLGVALTASRPALPLSVERMSIRAKNVSRNLEIPMDQAMEIVKNDEAARATSRVNEMPPAIALFGLIPFGVGLAYLIFYYSDESRKRRAADAPSDLSSSQV